MITITGKHNTAICFCEELEDTARAQITALCDREEFSDSKIRIMPDVHAGMGCTIGTTMTITDKVVPGIVGVDIGCGMETVRLLDKDLDFAFLDRIIRAQIPSGRSIRNSHHTYNSEIDLESLRCKGSVNLSRARLSIGTLGGGNHFIEVGRSEEGDLYLVVHSGSRHLGNEVATLYQNLAIKQVKAKEKESTGKKSNLPRELSYVSGQLFEDYLHDMKLIQRFATLNRKAMVQIILSEGGLREAERFTTIHNYIDTDTMILRKGAVSSNAGELLLVPMNMRDGSIICVGKGNPDWNYSAPHGAGRIMSRRQAFATLSMDKYKKEMKHIYSTSINRDTLDEAPMAYKPMESIIRQIRPTATIKHRLTPVYNFKAKD